MIRRYTAGRIRSRAGLTYTEILICLILIALLAGAIGAALYQAHERTGRVHVRLTRQQNRMELVRLLADELRFATQINALDSTGITFFSPRDGGVTISYAYDDGAQTVSRSEGYGIPETVAENVTVFSLEAETVSLQGTNYLEGVRLTLKIGPGSSQQVEQYLELMNLPEM